MKREELFEHIKKVNDPKKDHAKILSNLHYTHFYLMDKYKKLLEDYDLSVTQSNVLGIIGFYFPKPVSLEEIKAMILEPHSDVSRTVTRLVEKGFVEKVINKENKRKVCIQALNKGIKILQKIQAEKKFETFTSELTQKETQSFIAVLAKLRKE